MYSDFRRLTKEEKKLVKYLLKNNDKDLSALQVGRILLRYINFQGIHYNANDNCVEIFKNDNANAHYSYKRICDLCLFIEELQESGLIIVDSVMNNKGTIVDEQNDFWIYDHKKYVVEQDNIFCIRTDGVSLSLPIGTPVERFHSDKLSKLLRSYVHNKVIIPRTPLKQLKKHGFLSRGEKQLRIMVLTMVIMVLTFLLGVVADFITPNWNITNTKTKEKLVNTISNDTTKQNRVNDTIYNTTLLHQQELKDIIIGIN